MWAGILTIFRNTYLNKLKSLVTFVCVLHSLEINNLFNDFYLKKKKIHHIPNTTKRIKIR